MTFQPNAGAATGSTVKVTANSTPTSVAGSVDCRTVPASTIRITNTGTVIVFVRMSAETTPTATAADLPIKAGDTRYIGNPVSLGLLGVAVLSITTTAADVYFTPGNGGI